MAAKEYHHFDSHFQDILENIDVKLITPFLIKSGIVSANDQDKVKEKSKKSVKYILHKVRDHDKDDLFKDCLKETCSESQGHQKLLKILYNPKDSSSGNIIILN